MKNNLIVLPCGEILRYEDIPEIVEDLFIKYPPAHFKLILNQLYIILNYYDYRQFGDINKKELKKFIDDMQYAITLMTSLKN